MYLNENPKASGFFLSILFLINLYFLLSSLVAQIVKCLPVMWETQVQSLGQEDPLEKGMAIHSSVFVWRIPWTEEPGGLQSWGCKESDTTERLSLHLSSNLKDSCWSSAPPIWGTHPSANKSQVRNISV